MQANEKKLFLGGRLRRLRRELAVTQTRMAEDLGVSPSYLNHLERNQRPLTAQVLLRLAEAYDIDMRSLSADIETHGADSLSEVFADALFTDIAIPRHELAEVAENFPTLAESITRLYHAYRNSQQLGLLAGDDIGGTLRPRPALAASGTMPAVPSDWVRDYVQGQRNHFPELEDLAQSFIDESSRHTDMASELRDALAAQFSIQIKIVPGSMFPDASWRYDHHRKRLFLSEALSEQSRQFALAYQLGNLKYGAVLNELADLAAAPNRAVRSLLRVSLVNYLAAAILMPYEAFHNMAENSRYDLDILTARFGVSYEQAAHRLTTLGRPSQRGIPFFMVRVDQAGNISKRFASGAYPFSRFGSACPRWALHSCFKASGRIITQIIETLDGQRYFTLSRSVRRQSLSYADEDFELGIGLGCELKFANRLIYARGLDLDAPNITGVGPACRVCDRPACPQRAAEPLNRVLNIEEEVKSISPYPFISC